MSASTPRILVVEDFEQFRQFICCVLARNGDFQVDQASDGLEAVQKVEEQRPDLILLDIGLPKLNGLEVARRVRKLPVPPRILFISQESSPEVVREALSNGALGYVHKLRAERDLLPAVEAVLIGKRFVSRGLEIKERCLVGQIGYDYAKVMTRAHLLEALGYEVVSAMGNEAARRVLDLSRHWDFFIVGHAAPKEVREEMVAWLRAKLPGVPILALNPPETLLLSGADYNEKQNAHERWLFLITDALSSGSARL